MSNPPAISVVVPFFDSARTIGACLDALLAQEEVEGGFEILLVDNESTDRSRSIAEDRAGVTILEEPTPGAYAARNTGVRRAAAPLIAFTDADCVVDRRWLSAIQRGMRRPGTAILIGHCRYPAEASTTVRWLGAWENAKAEYVIDRCPPANHFAYCNNMAVRSSVFEELGGFEEWPRAADSELVHRLADRRPDLEPAFEPSMRITHLEFVRGRARARRLRLYSRTNLRIPTFRELGVAQRFGVLIHLVRARRSE